LTKNNSQKLATTEF